MTIRHLILLLAALCWLRGAEGQAAAPKPIARNALPKVTAAVDPVAKCIADYPGCSACAKNAKGAYVCTACKPYAPRVTTGYKDRAGNDFTAPFCNGFCWNFKTYGTVMEDDSSPCVSCTETGGCGTCKAGSFKTPDAEAQTKYGLPSMPIQCQICTSCQLKKCSGTAGCLTCEVDASNKPLPKMKVPNASQTGADLNACIYDLCDDYDWDYLYVGGDVNAANRYIYPSNVDLYSTHLNCKRQVRESPNTGSPTSPMCSNQAGCTACNPAHFLTPNPIVPGTAICTPCDGCPKAQCGANGCTACPNAVLNKRVAHPWGLTGMNGKPVMVCRNAAGATTPFKMRTGLLTTSVWPASEFGNCPTRGGDYKINWQGADTIPSDFTISKWWDLPAIEFQSNDTVQFIFDAINNQRVKVTLKYKDKSTLKPVVKTVYGAFPIAQTRLCISVDNFVTYNDANAKQQLQIYFNTPATWNKRIQLRLSGEPSLTTSTYGHTYGKVTVFGKRSSEAKYTEVASLKNGINWKAADWAKVVILPEQTEWPALVTKAGTV